MRRSIPKLKTFLMLMVVALFSLSAMAQTVNQWHQDGKIYFKLKNSVNITYSFGDCGKMKLDDVEILAPLVDEYGITEIRQPFFTASDKGLERTYMVSFDNKEMIQDLIKDLENMAVVDYAEPVPIFKPFLTVNDEYFNYNADGGFLYGSANASWHLNLINAEAAWDITTGDANVKVAVLDNAIWTDHPDLTNKIVEEIDLGDLDSVASPPEGTYIWSHGTHSAGLIGAETNNGIGVASIGYDVSLIAVKLGQDASDGQGMTAGFEGIVWAADNGADVISMSWGSPQYFQT
ncbi:MAG: hypothetical protein C0594_09630, partial [Marinilabiliales bacterium]